MDIVIGGNSSVGINWVPCDPLGSCSMEFFCGCYQVCGCYNACGLNNVCGCRGTYYCECYGGGTLQ